LLVPIPSEYKDLAGYLTVYTESELRIAIAIAEVLKENNIGTGSGGEVGGEVSITDGTDTLLINPDGSINTSISALPAGDNNIGNVDVLSLPSIPTGNNNIGDVDVASLPVAFNSGASSANTQRTVTSSDSPEVVALGATADTSATTDTGTFSIISFIKRLLSVKLPASLGTKTAANSFAVIPASDYSPQAVGNVAAAATDSGNPVKIGGVFNTTRPTYTNGQRGNIEISVRGGLLADFEDYVTTPNNINAADVGSSTVVGANNQNIITGTPTNNSFASVLFSGNSSFAVLISGTWVGTLQFERTLDGGSTWTSIGAFSAGTNFITQTTTANGAFHGNSSSSNGIRVRAIAWTSGVASVRILLGQGTGTITIGNPIRLFDGVSGSQGTIKPANTPAAATDTALVVTMREGLMPAATSVSYMGTSTGANLKASAGNIYAITCTNLNASVRYFQVFDKASAAAPGDTPVRSFPVYGNGGLLIIGQDIIGGTGIALSTCISWGISTTALIYTAATAAETMATVRYA